MIPAAATSAARPSPNKRAVLTALLVLAACAAAAAPLACNRSADAGPNVIVVVIDTARADRCSFTGYDRETTPRLAEVAREGWTFTNAWSPAPWTLPAHASLFTGVGTGRHGCGRDDAMNLASEWKTLAEALEEAGWVTGAFSANPFVDRNFGTAQGFQHVEPSLHALPGTACTAVHDRALQWMREQAGEGRRFFAFLNDMEGHTPFDPPERFAARFRRGDAGDASAGEAALRKLTFPHTALVSLQGTPFAPAKKERMSDLYDADIAHVDDELGRLLATLREEGILDRTLLVVVSDHGEGLADHGWVEHSLGVHAELLRVPMLLRLPGRFDGGRKLADLVRLEDVYPTVLEACGVAAPEGVEGVSVTHDLAGRVAFGAQDPWKSQWPKSIREAGGGDVDMTPLAVSRRSATDGRFHLLVDTPGSVQLFDLANDPRETTDVAAKFPAEVARLRELLAKSSTR